MDEGTAVNTVTSTVTDVTLLSGWWVQILCTIIVAILGCLWLLLRKFVGTLLTRMEASEAEKKAIDALLIGMSEQQPIANGIKKAAADGKITKEEAKNLEDEALKIAKEIATGPAKEVVLNWGEKEIGSLIKQLLAKFKARK